MAHRLLDAWSVLPMPKRPSKRSKSHHTITPPAPGKEIQRHLRDLGLESLHAYQSWCREHGFRVGLDKNWHELRDEARHAQRAAEEAAVAAERQRHIESLGLKDEAEYQDWCARHGL